MLHFCGVAVLCLQAEADIFKIYRNICKKRFPVPVCYR